MELVEVPQPLLLVNPEQGELDVSWRRLVHERWYGQAARGHWRSAGRSQGGRGRLGSWNRNLDRRALTPLLLATLFLAHDAPDRDHTNDGDDGPTGEHERDRVKAFQMDATTLPHILDLGGGWWWVGFRVAHRCC